VEEVITKKENHYMSLPVKDQSIEGIARDTSLSLGQGGAVYTADTSSVEGNFGAIQALEDSVFTSLNVGNWGGSATDDLPLPAGATIFGNFTSYTLTSGKVVAYKNV
jgi:hypothetical protein